MLIDGRRLVPGSVIDCAVCVVGSGAAGTTVALELIRRGHDVVVLEAGGRRRTRTYQETYEGDVVASEFDERSVHPALDRVRVKRLGGTTGVWGGRCAPLDPIDLEGRDYVPESDWPITHEVLFRFYPRANAYCEAGRFEYSVSEALPGAEAFVLHEGDRAEITDSKLLRYSRPTDFGKRYRERLKRSRLTRVLQHASVLRLELDPSGQRVDHVVVASSPGREFRVRARCFVIAAGGLETARLLLVSGNPVGRGIGSGREHTGHHYMTHLDAVVGSVRFEEEVPRPAYTYEPTHDGIYCRRLIGLTPDAQRANGVLNLGAVMYVPEPQDPAHGDALLSSFALTKDVMYRTKAGFKSSRRGIVRQGSLDYRRHLLNIARHPWRLPRFTVDWLRRRTLASRKLPSFLVASRSGRYRLLFSAEQSPSSENKVELSDRWDAFGMPRIRVGWGVKEDDYGSVLTSLGVIARNFELLGVGSLEVPGSVDQLLDEMGGGFLGSTHAMGTTRMSASSKRGVVDADCRVHGVGNLYVASSSVFPTSGFAPPTLTIVALAIRIAERIHARS